MGAFSTDDSAVIVRFRLRSVAQPGETEIVQIHDTPLTNSGAVAP